MSQTRKGAAYSATWREAAKAALNPFDGRAVMINGGFCFQFAARMFPQIKKAMEAAWN